MKVWPWTIKHTRRTARVKFLRHERGESLVDTGCLIDRWWCWGANQANTALGPKSSVQVPGIHVNHGKSNRRTWRTRECGARSGVVLQSSVRLTRSLNSSPAIPHHGIIVARNTRSNTSPSGPTFPHREFIRHTAPAPTPAIRTHLALFAQPINTRRHPHAECQFFVPVVVEHREVSPLTMEIVDHRPAAAFRRTSSAYDPATSIFARSTSACTVVSTTSYHNANSNSAPPQPLTRKVASSRDFTHNTSLVTLCDDEPEVAQAFGLKSLYRHRASTAVPPTPQLNCVEKNSMVWNKHGKRVILDDDFERRVERERHLRMSLDSESCALIQLSSKSSFFRSKRSARSSPCVATPLPKPKTRRTRRSILVSCLGADEEDIELRDNCDRNSANRRERVEKLFQDTGNIALKIVAVPAVIIFDIVGSIFGWATPNVNNMIL